MKRSLLAKLNNNRGFSLSELLTVVLLLAVLTLGITVMITSGVRTYNDSLYISEASTVESMINKAFARELRYAEPTELADGGTAVRQFKIGNTKYEINLNSAGYLVETREGTDTAYLLNIGSYANMHVTNLRIDYSGKVFTCNYTLSDKSGTKTKDVSYTVRTSVFLRDGWTPGGDEPDPPVVPTPPPPKSHYPTLTIYYYIDPEPQPAYTYTDTYYEGETYNVKSQSMPGYSVDREAVKGTMGEGDITEKVHYSLIEYKINYEGVEDGKKPDKQTYTIKDTMDADLQLKDASRTGYTFKGWYWDEALTQKADYIPQYSTGDKTVYAKWEIKKFTVTITTNNPEWGSVDVTSVTEVPYNTQLSTTRNVLHVNGTDVTASAAESTPACEYSFSKWENGNIKVTDNTTVTAVFNKEQYWLVTFNSNGHGTSPESKYVKNNTKVSSPGTLSPVTGYTHNGKWYKDPACTQEWSFNTAVTSDMTLYAKWNVNKHNVTVCYYDTVEGRSVRKVVSSGEQGWQQFIDNSDYQPDPFEKEYAATVTISKSDPEGYKDPKYSAVTESGKPVTMSGNSFTMPDEDVTVTVIYTKKTYKLKIAGMYATFGVTVEEEGKVKRTLKENGEIKEYKVLSTVFDIEYGAYIEINATDFSRGEKYWTTNYWFILASDHNTSGSTSTNQYNMLIQKGSVPASGHIYMPALEYTTTKDAIYVGAGSINSGCLAEGTLITLYDGTQKAIEDITQEDVVLVYNHFTGELEASHILIDCHENNDPSVQMVMNLVFDDGTILRTVNHHGLFDSTLNKYVNISPKRYEEFIGDEFYTSSGKTVKLEEIYFTEEKTRVYAPLSDGCINVFAEGILTVTPGVDSEECLFSLFEMDENMKYDRVKAARDILKYGLYTYEDFEPYGLSEELFEAVQGKYLKVAVGKGILTFDDIVLGISMYNDIFVSSLKE